MDLPVPLGHVFAQKYRVDHVIGSGGMGVVVRGYHLELDQPIAIKFLSVMLDRGVREESAERFRREARTAARIHSEHTVKVLDTGVVGDVPYMVMELLQGNDLGQELARHGPLPIGLAAHYLLQAIDAIAEAHALGIVHRDLKPGNLFLAQGADGTRSIKVLDFGISKTFANMRTDDVVLTKTASMIGSPLYMSPEQMRSARDVDARSDIWSLGAILYELISGSPPYPAESIPALCVAVMNDDLRPIRTLVLSAPNSLDVVLARCMNRNLAARFATAADLADALVEFTPGSRRYAERARRLLATPSVRASMLPSVDSEPDGAPTRLAPTMSERFRSRPGATQTSWGQTDRGAMNKRRIPIVFAAFVALGACAALVWQAFQDPSSGATVSSASASSHAAPPPAAIAAAKPAAEEVDVPSSANAGTVEFASPGATASAEGTQGPDGPKPARQAVVGRPRVPGGQVSRVSQSPPKQPSGKAPGSITDFGGRRY